MVGKASPTPNGRSVGKRDVYKVNNGVTHSRNGCMTIITCCCSPVRLLSFKKFPKPFSRSKFSFSRSTVRLQPFKIFLKPFTVSVLKTACLSVSHPFTCRAFNRSNGYRKQRFRVRGQIFHVER